VSQVLHVFYHNNGVRWYLGAAEVSSGSALLLADTATGLLTASTPFTMGVADRIVVTGSYEAA
jgi:hypothetical protein